MTTLTFGAAGQLGRELCARMPNAVAVTRADVELTDATAVSDLIAARRPAVVVNCAAYNFVDKAESEPHAAFAVNAWAVRDLARACADNGAKFVHVSSDYVFGLDAERRTPLTETDLPGPVSVYGMSKLAGEYAALAAGGRNLIVRTCGLYGLRGAGGKGGNFVETMLRVAGQGKPLRVVNDQFCTPSSATDVAAAIAALIDADAAGLVHVVNAGSCSWFEFAAEIFRAANVAADLTPIPTSEYPTAARRPAYSVLATDRLAALGIPRPRSWQEAVAEYVATRTN